MKINRMAVALIIVIAIAFAVLVRLIANKRSLDAELSAGAQFESIIPVLIDTVKEKSISSDFKINGSFSPFYEITVASETQGKVKEIFMKVGEKVIAKQKLALVDSELTTAQFKQAKANFEKAKKDLNRFKLLSQQDAVSSEQYESVKLAFANAQAAYLAAQKQYENSIIKAPACGIISRRHIETGTFLTPGMPVFDIVEIKKVKFLAKLTSDEIQKVRTGQQVAVSAESFSGVRFEGIVSTVTVSADLSHRYDVEVIVNNREDKLIRPGMFGSVYFEDPASAPSLVIPRQALTGSINEPEVFVVKDGDSVALQRITAEVVDENYLAVAQGLHVGDRVVVSGQINLSNGSKIRIIR